MLTVSWEARGGLWPRSSPRSHRRLQRRIQQRQTLPRGCQSLPLVVLLPALMLRRPVRGRNCRPLDVLWPQPLVASETARNMRGLTVTLPGPPRIPICAVRVGTEVPSPLTVGPGRMDAQEDPSSGRPVIVGLLM